VGVPVAPPLAEPRWRLSRDQVLALVTVLVVAAGTVLRLRAVLAAPGVLYPDEIYQMTEAAHRVVFGYGITPWEFEPSGCRTSGIPAMRVRPGPSIPPPRGCSP
jgi:GPI mannosyltransferase 3